MESPADFMTDIRTTLTAMGTKRGVNRKKSYDLICERIHGYVLRQHNRILTLKNALLLRDTDTTDKLRKKNDDQAAAITALEAEIEHLMVQKMKTERFFEKQEAEMAALRKKAGIKLPTFLEDTELT